MIVRDPVDRLVSHYNDNRPPRKIDIDGKLLGTKGGWYDGLSRYGNLLQSALQNFPQESILVVVNEIMKRYPQQVMDDICDFLHLPRRSLDLTAPPANALNHREIYNWPSDRVVQTMQDRYWQDTQLFLNLLGIPKLPWKIVNAKTKANMTASIPQIVLPQLKIAAFDAYWDMEQNVERNKTANE
mmetsp:Transcript_1187/g.1854  ORF Transcript_1187/g.1854 Transcript_1187/m.1854 type:complete len:185 (+) Transcript_1187:2-556(+)